MKIRPITLLLQGDQVLVLPLLHVQLKMQILVAFLLGCAGAQMMGIY